MTEGPVMQPPDAAPPRQPGPPVAWEAPREQAGPTSARTRARVTVWLLVADAIVSAVAVLQTSTGFSLADRFESGLVSDAEATAWDGAFGAIGSVQSLLFVLTAVAWLAWQHRLVSNVEPLGLGRPYRTPGWSIVWWAIPIANLVMVPRIYTDLFARLGGAGRRVGLVATWWLVYLFSGVIAEVAGLGWARVETIDQFRDGLGLWMVSDAVSVVSAGIAIVVVRTLQAHEDARTGDAAAVAPAPTAMAESSAPEA